MTSNLLLNL